MILAPLFSPFAFQEIIFRNSLPFSFDGIGVRHLLMTRDAKGAWSLSITHSRRGSIYKN